MVRLICCSVTTRPRGRNGRAETCGERTQSDSGRCVGVLDIAAGLLHNVEITITHTFTMNKASLLREPHVGRIWGSDMRQDIGLDMGPGMGRKSQSRVPEMQGNKNTNCPKCPGCRRRRSKLSAGGVHADKPTCMDSNFWDPILNMIIRKRIP